MQSGHSNVLTEGIRVIVSAQLLPEQSAPEAGHYVYAYRVSIANEGTQWARLLSRYWLIRDAAGEPRVVEGPGVVGKQPELEPGARHEYSSGCPLRTEWGTMEGHFVMEREDGSTFQAEVGRFFLAPSTRLRESQGSATPSDTGSPSDSYGSALP